MHKGNLDHLFKDLWLARIKKKTLPCVPFKPLDFFFVKTPPRPVLSQEKENSIRAETKDMPNGFESSAFGGRGGGAEGGKL
jgi:hypothetical protein